MILLWNSAEMEVELTLVDGETRYVERWQADRTLARNMLDFLRQQLAKHDLSFTDVTGIGVFRGPGSFTGLRIGMTVLNTWARAEHIPIVGEVGDGWKLRCLERLKAGDDDQILLPEYGSPAHVTKPRK